MRISSVVALSLVVWSGAGATEVRVLGKGALDGVAVELTQVAEKLQVSLASSPVQVFKLESTGWTNEQQEGLRKDQPLVCSVFELPGGASGCWITFGLDDGVGGLRAVAVLLSRSSSRATWAVAREWVADSVALGDMGFKREKQSFATDGGILTRTLRSLSVEGVAHKLDCGCTACSSRSSDTEETDVYAWNAAAGKFEPAKHEKYYIAQSGENLMAAVRKALGDARRVSHVAKLNPTIADGTVFKGGERVLVARDATPKP